jgi:hypothetical protein
MSRFLLEFISYFTLKSGASTPDLMIWIKSMRPRMESLYSLYDALIGINVPTERARAVVSALERDMDTKLATKADLKHLGELLSRDIRSLEERMRLEVATQIQSQTIRLGGMIAAAVAVLAALIKLT